MLNKGLLSVTDIATADPYLVHGKDGLYYLLFTAGDRIEIWTSPDPLCFKGPQVKKTVVWRPPRGTAYSENLWAPELHDVAGTWYVFFAADDGNNMNHRMYVIQGPLSKHSPTSGSWKFLGRVGGGIPADQWAIDGTLFPYKEELYFIYSGWRPGAKTDTLQSLYIARLSSVTTASSAPVLISRPTRDWEYSGASGINEGPQVLSDGGSWLGVAYSCAGSWTADYKMNTLRFLGGDPLDPRRWAKGAAPLLQSRRDARGPYGPGHGCFFQLQGDTIALFHATDGREDGWSNRRARAQRLLWGEKGPLLGECGLERVLDGTVSAQQVLLQDVEEEVEDGRGAEVGSKRHAILPESKERIPSIELTWIQVFKKGTVTQVLTRALVWLRRRVLRL